MRKIYKIIFIIIAILFLYLLANVLYEAVNMRITEKEERDKTELNIKILKDKIKEKEKQIEILPKEYFNGKG